MAEFDENIPLDEAGDEEVSKAELEVRQLVKQVGNGTERTNAFRCLCGSNVWP